MSSRWNSTYEFPEPVVRAAKVLTPIIGTIGFLIAGLFYGWLIFEACKNARKRRNERRRREFNESERDVSPPK